jgi:hypothetical protein
MRQSVALLQTDVRNKKPGPTHFISLDLRDLLVDLVPHGDPAAVVVVGLAALGQGDGGREAMRAHRGAAAHGRGTMTGRDREGRGPRWKVHGAHWGRPVVGCFRLSVRHWGVRRVGSVGSERSGCCRCVVLEIGGGRCSSRMPVPLQFEGREQREARLTSSRLQV